MITNYQELPIREEMKKAIAEMGFTEMTEIQQKAIPELLAGKEVIAKAPTGTGKTCAFGVPMVQRIQPEKGYVQGVILCPTRELCLQITEELQKLGKYIPGFSIVAVYGGQSMQPQINALRKNPQIVVATPGRLMDHMRRRNVAIDRTEMIVLDEADEMLDMGFYQDVRWILDRVPRTKQMSMFSATISREVMDIAWVYQRDAEEVTVREDEQNKPDIKQFRMDVSFDGKAEAIAKILNETGFDRCMVFCNTKGNTERICKFLQMRGVNAECIHGDIPQKRREEVMNRFRQGQIAVFVSTDVAARGIDVDDVDIVFNCDIPDENQDYVHRIGRTGRAKRQGVAVSLIADYPSKLRIDDIAAKTHNEIVPVRFNAEGHLEVIQ